jgi:hypothetical protein
VVIWVVCFISEVLMTLACSGKDGDIGKAREAGGAAYASGVGG